MALPYALSLGPIKVWKNESPGRRDCRQRNRTHKGAVMDRYGQQRHPVCLRPCLYAPLVTSWKWRWRDSGNQTAGNVSAAAVAGPLGGRGRPVDRCDVPELLDCRQSTLAQPSLILRKCPSWLNLFFPKERPRRSRPHKIQRGAATASSTEDRVSSPTIRQVPDGIKRVAGIEPAWPAWKAGALPLSYTREAAC